MTNTLTRLLLTAALCGLFLLSEAQERNAVSAPDPAAPRMPADSISRDYRLDGVVIGTQRPPSPLGSIAEGRFRLLMRNSSALPRFAGSIDPMRILQLMPGVQTAAEGNSGLYVRGNDAGQNLILLNQAPLYAHAHLLGFFSVFNPGQVASFELSKTGGGRIETAMQPATVVVQSREETGVRWGVEGDLGIIASQATVTAPLTDRAALFLSGRRSYTGWLIGALSPKGEDDLNYRLQDYDATLAWQIDDHNKLIVNSHYGDDRTHITYNEGLLGGRLNFSAEAYYQRMYRVLEYNAPLTGMVNNRYELEQYLHSGDGEAYGMEFMVSYAGRKFNGWISYTLGKSVRQFAALNDGLPFPASLDRRHDLSLAASYMPGERWELSTVFVYASGGAYTPTRDLYIAGGSFVRGHGSYNGARLPDYHRLDLSVTYWLRRKPWRSGINLSLFNLYAHRNPLYISWPVLVDEEKHEYQIHPRRHYLYTVIPSVSWIFKF